VFLFTQFFSILVYYGYYSSFFKKKSYEPAIQVGVSQVDNTTWMCVGVACVVGAVCGYLIKEKGGKINLQPA
jgi:hypothetical protein